MSRLHPLIHLVLLFLWATIATAQDHEGRDLVHTPSAAEKGGTGKFYVSFGPGVYDLAGLDGPGKMQVEQILASLGTPVWHDRVVVIETPVCSRPGAGADRPRAQQRAEALRELMLNRRALAPERIFILMRDPTDGENDEEHAQH